MFTAVTWQDWQSEGYDAVEAENTHAQAQKAEYIGRIIKLYKASDDFRNALTANEYFRGNNPEVQKKAILRKRLVDVEVQGEDGRTKKVQQTMANELIGNRIPNKIFGRFVIQQNQFLLSNGVTMQDATMKERLGRGFDKVLQRIGQNALKHGVGWGFWNHDHIESISAADDALTGFVALIDEMTQEPMVGIQFWQISSKKPMTVRLFEGDGITMYRTREGKLEISEPKRAYVVTSMVDALGVAAQTGTNYDRLPVIPFFANDEKASELTYAIKQKIDLYDRIVSDFGDNLDRTNDVYWVLNNYGGSTREIQSMLRMIEELRVVVNQTDGGTSSTAEPKTFEVPYVARQTALDLLRKALYDDYMALSMDELTGGSLTNVAIQAAMTNLNLKADMYEWQAFDFVQRVLSLIGIESEDISFQRQAIVNKSEIVTDIYVAREDLDRETRLKKNPYILQEEIDGIIERKSNEDLTGIVSVDELEDVVRRKMDVNGIG